MVHPGDVTGMHVNPCVAELIAQLIFLSNLPKKKPKKYTYKNKGVKSHSLTIH